MLLFCALALWIAPGSAAAQSARTFELISPVSKNNASILSALVIDSDHVALEATASMLDSDPFYVGTGQYVASRSSGTGGWTLAFSPITREASLADHLAGDDRIFESFTPLVPGEHEDVSTDVYRWQAGSISLVSTGSVGGQGVFESKYLTSSPGGTHIVFKTDEVLEPEDSGRTAGTMLYERVGDETRAVGLDSDEHPIGNGGAILGGDGAGALNFGFEGGTDHAISVDGSRIFFESPDPVAGGDTQLYVRENGETTTQVSASQRSLPGNGPLPARFEGASADGSLVYFRTGAQLVDADDDAYSDLYRYDLATHELIRVSAGQQQAESNSCIADNEDGLHGVCGVAAISDDGQRIYYLSTGALGDGAAGHISLYFYDGESRTTTTVLSVPNDLNHVVDNRARILFQTGLIGASPDVEATSDGSVLVFAADSALTSFDNTSPACPPTQLNNEGRCTEIYRYDAATDQITCLSCNPAGAPPLGPAELPTGGFTPRPARRFSTPDGSLVAFETADALVPEDVNGQTDVYEWRDGHVALVSSGVSPRRASLVGISADGSNIVFLTSASLVPEDTDTLTDLYDARIDGAPPTQPPPPPGQCLEDSCQPPPTNAPQLGSPTTAMAGSDGNVVSPRAKVKLVRITSAGRRGRRLVRIELRVNRPGMVAVTAAATVAGRFRTIGRAAKRAGRSGSVTLNVRLGQRAVRQLQRERTLKVAVTARLSKALRGARDSITLRTGRSR